jgi:hypothetical protein
LAKLRAYSRCCGCVVAIAVAAALATAAPAGAYVPSAVDQYTEQPPAHAGGPGSRAVKGHRGQAGGGSKGSTGVIVAGAGGALSPTTGSSANPGGIRSAGNGDGNPPGSSPKATITRSEPTADTLPVGGYPTTTLLWLALLAIVAAVLARLGIAARKRHSGVSAG